MDGFNLDDTITYTKYTQIKGRTRPIELKVEDAEISIKEAAEELKDFEFVLYIDRNSIVEKHQIALASKIIDFLGVVDPSALPNVAKSLMKRLADVMRVEIVTEDLEGIESSRALGGKSQFQSREDSTPQLANQFTNAEQTQTTLGEVPGLQGLPTGSPVGPAVQGVSGI